MPPGPRPLSAPLPADRDPRLEPRGASARLVLVAVGTRSEAVSLAPVARRLREDARFEVRLVAFARAREEISQALELFGQRADLEVTRRSARATLGRELSDRRVDQVLVQGASPAVHSVARWAHGAGVPVVHLGAGLRPGPDGMPRSEGERHRALSHLADLHLVHDEPARRTLLAESVPEQAVRIVGDPGADALVELHERVRPLGPGDLTAELGPLLAGVLERWGGRLVVVSARRRAVLDELCQAVRSAAARHPDWLFAWPVHPVPRVRTRVHQLLLNVANVVLCEPLDAATFAWLLGRSDVALTDSITLQGQGAALGRPVLVTRAKVERPDLGQAGLVRPVGARSLGILAGLERLLLDLALLEQLAGPARRAPTGAAEAVVDALAPPELSDTRRREVPA